MSAGKGFGKLDRPEVYSPVGVISRLSGPTALRMSIVAAIDTIAIHTLFIARKRPGQILRVARTRVRHACGEDERFGGRKQ